MIASATAVATIHGRSRVRRPTLGDAELEQEVLVLREANNHITLPDLLPDTHFVQEDEVILPYDMPPSPGFSPTRICVESDTPFQLSVHGPRGGHARISYQR